MHLPLGDSTLNILSEEHLRLMKQTAVLINITREGLGDEIALKKMLLGKRLADASFDVFAIEPPEDLKLLDLPNFHCYIPS